MKCPACNTVLLITERQGIEIDYCPDCRGIWLDRGELDKIIEKSAGDFPTGSHKQDYYKREHHGEHHHDHEHDDHDSAFDPKTGRKKRREGPLGFLGDLFD